MNIARNSPRRTGLPPAQPAIGSQGFYDNRDRIRSAFRRPPAPPTLVEAIADAYRTMHGLPPAPKAVESSVVDTRSLCNHEFKLPGITTDFIDSQSTRPDPVEVRSAIEADAYEADIVKEVVTDLVLARLTGESTTLPYAPRDIVDGPVAGRTNDAGDPIPTRAKQMFNPDFADNASYRDCANEGHE